MRRQRTRRINRTSGLIVVQHGNPKLYQEKILKPRKWGWYDDKERTITLEGGKQMVKFDKREWKYIKEQMGEEK